MTTHNEALRDGTCCVLELRAKRGSLALEQAIQRMTPRQRALVPATFIETLRHEAAQRAVTA